MSGADEARRRLYDAMATDAPFEEKATEVLEIGASYLEVDNGHLTRIEPDDNFWTAVASTDSEDGEFPPGLVLDLDSTYCRRTVQQGDSIALHDAPEQGWDDDPAFQEHQLHCYHGSVISVDDETYGTVCFVSHEPRSEPFSEEETLFAELLARLLEHEIARQRTERQIERLDEFASMVSHDLRNPLTVAKGRVAAERERRDSDNLETAATALDRMEALIADALALARAGQQDLDVQSVDLATVARDAWETVDTGDASLTVDVDLRFRADPNRLRRLFENLFRNAVEHGGPKSTVRVGPLEDGSGFFVADDGVGIPDGKREQVFETGYSTASDGTGFGLAIVRNVAAVHDWTVDVTDGDDGGARFEISGVVIDRSG